jgi:hypothetical protein
MLPKLTEDQKKFISEMGQKVLPDEEFNTLLHEQSDEALESLKEGKSEFIGRMIAYGEKKNGKRETVFMLFADFSLPEKRQEMFMGIGAKLATSIDLPNFFPVCIILTTEAWTKSFENGEEKNRDRMVSEYDDKKECIITAGVTMDKRQKTIILPITRDKNNNLVAGEKEVMGNPENILVEKVFEGFGLAKLVEEQKLRETKKPETV